MEKGKLGIRLSTYAVVAFACAIVGATTVGVLVLAAALFFEKDEWTSRQCMQALFLDLFSSIVYYLIGFIPTLLSTLGSFADYGTGWYTFTNGLGNIFDIIRFVIQIIFIIFMILGLLNVAKGQEAKAPIVENWANKAYGIMPQVPQAISYTQQAPYQQQPYQQPQAPVAPQQGYPQPQAPAAPYQQPQAPVAPQQPQDPNQQPPYTPGL